MKFMDVLNNTKWTNINTSLKSLYPDSTEEDLCLYQEVYKFLLKLEPIDTNFIIYLREEYDEDFHDEPYISVSGRNETLNKELSDFKNFNMDTESDFANSEVSYSLALSDWAEWLGMSIDHLSLEIFNKNDITAHCLWEMTFYGFDPLTINNHVEELNRRVDEIKNMTEEERKEKLIPWEKVIEDIED